jgi:hypothetical protein
MTQEASQMPLTMHFDDLPARIHTGPVKFGHDWTGIFVRGEDCAGIAKILISAAKVLDGEAQSDVVKAMLAQELRTEAARFQTAFDA